MNACQRVKRGKTAHWRGDTSCSGEREAITLRGAPIPDGDPDWEWQPMPTRFDVVDGPGRQPDLLVRRRQAPEQCLLFTLGLPISPDRHWLAPGRRNAVDRARTGRRRARAYQTVLGGRLWGGVVVDVRGFPELRVLQVAIAYRWTSIEAATASILERLRGLGIWHDHNAEADANAVTALLVEWAQRGEHLASLPLTRGYLRLTAKGDHLPELNLALFDEEAVAAGWPSSRDHFTDDHTAGGAEVAPADAQAGPAVGSIRRLARQLREQDGIGQPDEDVRREYLARAEKELIARATLRHRRLATKAYLGERVGARAVERFFQRHGADPDFHAVLGTYVARRGPAE